MGVVEAEPRQVRLALFKRHDGEDVQVEPLAAVRGKLAEKSGQLVAPAQHQHAPHGSRPRTSAGRLAADGREGPDVRLRDAVGVVFGDKHEAVLGLHHEIAGRAEVRAEAAAIGPDDAEQHRARERAGEVAKQRPGQRRVVADVQVFADPVREEFGVGKREPGVADVLRNQAAQERVTGDEVEGAGVGRLRNRDLARIEHLGHDGRLL